MSLSEVLKPHMARMYTENDGTLSAQAAVALLREVVEQTDGGDALLDEAADIGLGAIWGGFYGRVRQRAQREARRLAVRRTFAPGKRDVVVQGLLQAMLPLPDGVKPLRSCHLIELRRAAAALRQQVQALTAQEQYTIAVSDQMEIAVEATGNGLMSVGEADDLGLIDWAAVLAA